MCASICASVFTAEFVKWCCDAYCALLRGGVFIGKHVDPIHATGIAVERVHVPDTGTESVVFSAGTQRAFLFR